jgi:uncharacterized protein
MRIGNQRVEYKRFYPGGVMVSSENRTGVSLNPVPRDIYRQLARRIGKAHLTKRVDRQVKSAAEFYAKGGYARFHLENTERIYVLLKIFLKTAGLYRRGLNNSIDYRVITVRTVLENLPQAFHGFRILQLTDIHADGICDGGEKLARIIETLHFDLCVITGDFRFLTQDAYTGALEKTARIASSIKAPHGILGILGNHDFIEFVPGLEAAGIRMLINESTPIPRDNEEIWISGIDDAHLYDCHDISKTLNGIPAHATTIMLSHTPEVYREAGSAGVDYLLCGHTHGGQICLPGGIPIITNARCPRSFCAGPWGYRRMKGYTSRAAGASGLPVRFFCPPEITVHELLKEEKTASKP